MNGEIDFIRKKYNKPVFRKSNHDQENLSNWMAF